MDDENYHDVAGKQGVPWAIRKLLQKFTPQRECKFVQGGDDQTEKRFLFRSKMLTGTWNELAPDEPTTFSVLGYNIDTLVTWEEDGRLLVATTKTTASDGYFTSGWTATTRITHAVTANGEMEIVTITPEGEYKMYMTRSAVAT